MDVVMVRPRAERAWALKAALDYAIAFSLLVLFLPLFAVIAVAVKQSSSGPIFFRQRRYGYRNREFHVYKFRTMSVMEDGAIVTQAERSDSRVTRVGRFLRRTSLDELPQLLNVLRGEMSIVGPRPHAIAHNEQFAQVLELYPRRHRVKPGITGWAQIHGHRGEIKEPQDIRMRLEHDLYYIDNWSVWLDLEILSRTFLAVLVGRGAY
jgi:putative colanic acid biosynthesis UDP-glucose lipid carrier transferase